MEENNKKEESTSISHSDDVSAALLVYKNMQVDLKDQVSKLNSSHLDKVTVSNVFTAITTDLSYEPNRFQNKKAQRLYQTAFAIIKAKNVINKDLMNKLNNNEVEGVSEESKEKLLKDLS